MCGIAGFSLSPTEQVNSKKLARALLLGIEHRGPDATGFAFRDSTGALQVHKRDLTASEFVKRRLCLPRNAKVAIMHTRYATQGHESWNENNHPIATGSVVGVHNGHIWNDDILFREYQDRIGRNIRIAEVDSEVIFAGIGHADALNTSALDVLEVVRGGAAVAWLDKYDTRDELHVARVQQSPLWVGETVEGSFVFASTDDAIIDATAATGMVLVKLREIDEGTYLGVLDGEIADVRGFTPAWDYYNKHKRSNVVSISRKGNYYDDAWEGTTEWESWNDSPNTVLDNDWRDSEDDEDERYERWWLENEAASQAGPIRLYDYFDPEVRIPYLTHTEMRAKYPEREQMVMAFLRGYKSDDREQYQKTIRLLKLWCSVGAPVRTQIDGLYSAGHVVHTPDTIDGNYVIRLYVPNYNDRHPGNVESVFVSRKYFEFEYRSPFEVMKLFSEREQYVVGKTPDDDQATEEVKVTNACI